ncbi:PorT family protein [Chryseobacterium indologenes]|uniref:porin family protein n=1 Tax=Chryseobacterium indologenes TaxID=253 RepID=UPI000F4E69E0|nr:porin family protein [Chryseobacterium indologenes]AYZ37729.1 PorT family protein [Chryseobacterium indologenes]MBF6646623.1 PorT family protein [Chryseobacterium indologenes]MBU3049213.1 PorT family protein [Chryseobacterium indologenes]MEB4760472.1 porin family protein [Chryseobacterium indologenes]QQQ69716.1 PorT family protein [Chryseobacterium indologenes]
MKKFLAITAVVLGLGLQAQQNKDTKKDSGIELIPKAGITIATQSIKNMDGEKFKTSFQAGLGVNIQTGLQNFSVQPEVNFISKGTRIKNHFGNQTYNFNYIEIPVLAKYSFGPVYVNAGPSIGFLVGKSDKIKAAYGKTKTLDFGLQMGAGVAIPAGPGKLIVDGRYNLGLSNISDEKGVNVKNRGFAVSLGYAIPL